MIRTAILVTAFLGIVHPAIASDADTQAFIDSVSVDATLQNCATILSEDIPKPTGPEIALIHVRVGQQLACEARSLREQAATLRQHQSTLVENARGLEEEWRAANRVAPDKFPDFPGRDRSQKLMIADAAKLGATAKDLDEDADALGLEARRILRLAFADADQQQTVLVSVDPGGQSDLVARFLALIKKREKPATPAAA